MGDLGIGTASPVPLLCLVEAAGGFHQIEEIRAVAMRVAAEALCSEFYHLVEAGVAFVLGIAQPVGKLRYGE